MIADRSGPQPLVVDATPQASGVVAGMTLKEALSRSADATVLDMPVIME